MEQNSKEEIIIECPKCGKDFKFPITPPDSYRVNSQVYINALQKIEQMSDPGSYEKAIVEMKSIATDALKCNEVNSQEDWISRDEYEHAVNTIGQLQEQLQEANEYIKDLQKGYEH